jgi:hypothetical protein
MSYFNIFIPKSLKNENNFDESQMIIYYEKNLLELLMDKYTIIKNQKSCFVIFFESEQYSQYFDNNRLAQKDGIIQKFLIKIQSNKKVECIFYTEKNFFGNLRNQDYILENKYNVYTFEKESIQEKITFLLDLNKKLSKKENLTSFIFNIITISILIVLIFFFISSLISHYLVASCDSQTHLKNFLVFNGNKRDLENLQHNSISNLDSEIRLLIGKFKDNLISLNKTLASQYFDQIVPLVNSYTNKKGLDVSLEQMHKYHIKFNVGKEFLNPKNIDSIQSALLALCDEIDIKFNQMKSCQEKIESRLLIDANTNEGMIKTYCIKLMGKESPLPFIPFIPNIFGGKK